MLESMSEQDRETLKQAVELVWRKGTHNPQEASIAFSFTQLVQRICGVKPQSVPPPAPSPKDDAKKSKGG